MLLTHSIILPVITTHKSLHALMDYVEKEKHKAQDVLILLDIDNTIAHPVTEVGSDQWLEYMAHKEAQNGIPISQAYDQFLPLYYKLQHVIDLSLVEDYTPTLIEQLKMQGFTVLGLTTRHDPIIDRTIEQLAPLGVSFSNLCDMPLSIEAVVKPAIYKNGIIFCSSNNKGDVLVSFLNKLKLNFKKIIFIDDKMSNLIKVEKAVASFNRECLCIHYTGCEERIKNFNPAQAEKELSLLNI